MYFLKLLILFCVILIAKSNDYNESKTPAVSDIADNLVYVLGVDTDKTKRLKELKEKLKIINSYVIDKDKYAELLNNETTDTNLNETNFFEALSEDDHLQFLLNGEPKNLYLKLKEKMNRDDIMKILSERNKTLHHGNSARKQMDSDWLEKIKEEEDIHAVVDEMLAEVPKDYHRYSRNKHDSIYWDPIHELKDLNDYHKHDGRRIFKGERTTVKKYPFMVSLHVMGRFWCGGVIYWHDLVLTSAACLQLMHNNRFFRENPRVLQVRVGSNHSRIGGELIDALEVYFHPSYNPRSLRNNIAVVRLRRHLVFNYHRIPKVIEISHNEGGVPAIAEVMLLGWGVTKISQKLSYEPIFLQKKVLPVYPNKFCKDVYGDKFISESMFCAGTMTTGEGACDHDAGGPAILSGQLVGIISFGPTICGYPNSPTVFTLVGAFADWIETVNETMPGYYRGRGRTTTKTDKIFQKYIATLVTHGRVTPFGGIPDHLPTLPDTVFTNTPEVTQPVSRLEPEVPEPSFRKKKRGIGKNTDGEDWKIE